MSQLSYSLNVSEGKAGLIAYAGNQDKTIVSLNNPVDAIEFGRAVAKVTGEDGQCKLPDGSGVVIDGISVLSTNTEGTNYPAKSSVGVMRKGQIYVQVEEDVTSDDPVYVRYDGKAQVQTIVFDADIITGNTVMIDVDGVTLTQAFDTNHLTSITALADQIAAEPGVSTATVGGSGNRTITVTAAVRGTDVVLENEEVTGGVSQATITITETVAGIANADRGLFRNDADSSTALQITRARYTQGAAAGGFAIVDINIP